MWGFSAVALITEELAMTALTPTAPVVETLFPDLDPDDVHRNRRFAGVVEALGRKAVMSLPELLPSVLSRKSGK